MTLGAGSVIMRNVDGGDGEFDTICLSQNEGEASWLSQAHLANYVNFEKLSVTGAGEFNIDQNLAGYNVEMEGGNLVVHHGVTLDGNIAAGTLTAEDTVKVFGTVTGNVSLFAAPTPSKTPGGSRAMSCLVRATTATSRATAELFNGTIDVGQAQHLHLPPWADRGLDPRQCGQLQLVRRFWPGTLDLALNEGQQLSRISSCSKAPT